MPFTIPDGENADQEQDLQDLTEQYQTDSSQSPQSYGQWLANSQSLGMAKGGNVKSPLLPSFEKGLESIPREKGTAAEFFRDAAARPGVKTQELEDRNLQSAYSDNTQKITKQQAHEIAASNPLQPLTVRTLKENKDREFGDEDDMGTPDDDEAQFKGYGLQFPDGKNYREKLYIDPTTRENTAAGHWPRQGGVLAHARVQDRETPEGKRAMHIEEIQSDVHQKGHKVGYREKKEGFYSIVEPQLNKLAEKAIDTLSSRLGDDVAKSQVQMIIDQARAYDNPSDPSRAMEAYRKAIRELGVLAYPHDHMYAPKDKDMERINADMWRHELRDYDMNMRESWGNKAPDMAFKNNWHEVVLKHLLHDAASEGHDTIYITPGKEQAQRGGKDLQDVSRFEYEYSPYSQKYAVRAYDKNNSQVDAEPEFDIKQIAKKFGNKVADRVAGSEGTELRNGARYFDLETPVTIGGEFHRNLYDKKIPNFLNSIGKKHGTQVRTEMSPVPPTGMTVMEMQELLPEIPKLDPRISEINTPEGVMPLSEAINKYFPNPFEKTAWKNELARNSSWAPDYNEIVEDKLIPEIRVAMNLPEKDWLKISAITPKLSPEDQKVHELRERMAAYRVGFITWSELKDYLSKNAPEMIDKLVSKRPVHRFDITPSLRKQILEEGLPMYKKGGDVDSEDAKSEIPALNRAKAKAAQLQNQRMVPTGLLKPVNTTPFGYAPELSPQELAARGAALVDSKSFDNPDLRGANINRVVPYNAAKEAQEGGMDISPEMVKEYQRAGINKLISKRGGNYEVNVAHEQSHDQVRDETENRKKIYQRYAGKPGGGIAEGQYRAYKEAQEVLSGKKSEDDLNPYWYSVNEATYPRFGNPNYGDVEQALSAYRDVAFSGKAGGGKVDIKDQSIWERIKNFRQMKKESEQTALDLFDPKGEHNGPADAMRHVLHNAKMTEAYGKPVAWALDKAHEYVANLGQPLPERYMDLYNGAIGRQIGSQGLSDAQMIEKARQAVQSGQARTLNAKQSNANYKKGGKVSTPIDTVKAYKLFQVKGGEEHQGKIYPLYVDADKPVPFNEWIEAGEGERGKAEGKVKSKIGDLAYRPGWHAGDLPIAHHIGGKSHGDRTLPPDTRMPNQVWAEVEMPNDRDWQSEANKRAKRNAKGEIIPKTAAITDQVPRGGHYRFKTNPNMTGEWLIGGSMRVNRLLSDTEVDRINKKAGTSDLRREQPFDFKGYGFKQPRKADGGSIQSPSGLLDDLGFVTGDEQD